MHSSKRSAIISNAVGEHFHDGIVSDVGDGEFTLPLVLCKNYSNLPH